MLEPTAELNPATSAERRGSPVVIGASGKKRSGKDTFLEILAAQARKRGISVVRRAFGDALKEEAAQFVAEMLTRNPRLADGQGDYRRRSLPDVYTEVLAEMHGDGPGKERYRLLLQWWGTEFRRDMYGPDYWVETLRDWIDAQPSPSRLLILVPDLRFPNEANLILKLGRVYRIERADLPADTHVSETSLDRFTGFTGTFQNNGTLAEFRKKAVEQSRAILDSLEF